MVRRFFVVLHGDGGYDFCVPIDSTLDDGGPVVLTKASGQGRECFQWICSGVPCVVTRDLMGAPRGSFSIIQ
jgi:hypothetical protein